jgi:hypothetical protein
MVGVRRTDDEREQQDGHEGRGARRDPTMPPGKATTTNA